jgi:hypothetical protein
MDVPMKKFLLAAAIVSLFSGQVMAQAVETSAATATSGSAATGATTAAGAGATAGSAAVGA